MPLERIFFDTNIVGNLRWVLEDPTFEDGFYDYKSQKFIQMGRELRRDCMALRYLIDKDDEFGLQFVISQGVINEVGNTPGLKRRNQLIDIIGPLTEHFEFSQGEVLAEGDLPTLSPGDEGRWHRLYQDGGLNFLPDDPDRRLIVDSVVQRSHVFLTVDYKTIWEYRVLLKELGVNVKRPLEYLRSFMFPMSPANRGYLGPDDILNLIEAV